MAHASKSLVVVVLLVFLLAPRAAHSQDDVVTLRTDAAFAVLAPRVARDASRRLGRSVVVSDGASTDAVTSLVVDLARVEDRAELSITGGSGARYVTRLTLASDEAASVRALVLALASLIESAADDPGPPVPAPPHEELPLLGPTDGSALRDLADPFERENLDARPLFDLRGRVGLGTQRDVGVLGPGLAAGVCFGPYCVVLDVDVLTPEEDHARRFGIVSYVFTTIGLGGRFLPLRAGPIRGGVGVSLFVRTGHLWIESQAVEATTFAAGGRFSAEGACMLADPVALVLSGGLDVAFNPTRFVRAAEAVFAEDVLVPWVALGLRISPE